MSILLDHPCCTVALDPETRVLRFTRTAAPYPSLNELVRVHERIGGIFDGAGRERHALLVDMRAATLNNDASFEEAAARGRALLVRGFGRVAVLVQTAVGALNVGRHMREDKVPGEVFSDEGTALAYLQRTTRDPITSIVGSTSSRG
jgi:hypothetical protein